MLGLIFLFVNALVYHYNDPIPVWYVGVGIVGICGFSWHDYQTTRVFMRYSSQKYEFAHFLERNCTKMEPQADSDGKTLESLTAEAKLVHIVSASVSEARWV